MIAGIISDTHGLLRPEAVTVLKGSDVILHAGDIGKPEVLERLRRLAPVFAIRGNTDTAEWASALPATTSVTAGPARIYILHDLQTLDLDPAAAGFHLVVSGHSHQPSHTQRASVIYLNPGSAGPRRFSLPMTVALVSLDGETRRAEIVPLL